MYIHVIDYIYIYIYSCTSICISIHINIIKSYLVKSSAAGAPRASRCPVSAFPWGFMGLPKWSQKPRFRTVQKNSLEAKVFQQKQTMEIGMYKYIYIYIYRYIFADVVDERFIRQWMACKILFLIIAVSWCNNVSMLNRSVGIRPRNHVLAKCQTLCG